MDDGTDEGDDTVGRLLRGAALGDAVPADVPDAWSLFDRSVRETPRYGHGWRAATDGTVPEHPLAGLPRAVREGAPLTTSELALALCHPDGRTRRAALRRAGDRPELLPLTVLRCADWAGPVRDTARDVLEGALDPDRAAALLPLVLRVGRRQQGAFAVALVREVLRAAAPERTAALLASPDRDVRVFACRLAVEEGFLSPVELARAAFRAPDPVVQDLCASAALASLAGGGTGAEDAEDMDAVLAPLLAARGPRARSAGVTGLRRAGRPERAVPFLADRSALVRACARYVVRGAGGAGAPAADPVAWYRDRCAAADDPTLPPGAVAGLGECGDRTDAALLRALLAHPAPGVRARAVGALRALDATDVRELWELLDDPAPGVVREATVALLPDAGRLPVDELSARLAPGRPRHVRSSAFRLLAARGGVAALRAAGALLDDPDERLRRRAGQLTQSWRPSAAEPLGDAEVGELLLRGRHLFSSYVLRRRLREAGLPDAVPPGDG
ncbi:HEAT repeat domain-containing protein [Streptomyces sp. NPDC008150]|uniref:HEAT repeat domain-containing protein n=1 Tax=Streptomyces sp. NPDC008150 TaxID=3364816 RepID=UPI0036ED4A0F